MLNDSAESQFLSLVFFFSAFMEPDHLAKKFRLRRSISKREAPYVIYPEILVIVDYDGYR
jgi:hypothetical protein